MADFKKAGRIIKAAMEKLAETLAIVEPDFVQLVIDWVVKFDQNSGNLSNSKNNKKRLVTFNRAIERFLLQSGYAAMVDEFLVNYNDLEDNQVNIQKDLNGINVKKTGNKGIGVYKQWAIRNTVAGLEGSGFTKEVTDKLTDEMFISINQGGSLKDLITSLTLKLAPPDGTMGLLSHNVEQISRDALGQYNGTVNEAVRKSFALDGYLYIGSVVKDTRPQCLRWLGPGMFGEPGLIAVEDLPNEIRWAMNNGTGFIKSTTPETWAANRGGFNCRHDAYPVRLSNFG